MTGSLEKVRGGAWQADQDLLRLIVCIKREQAAWRAHQAQRRHVEALVRPDLLPERLDAPHTRQGGGGAPLAIL